MSRVTKWTDEWFEIWYQDKQCILDTMVRNMTADLECGYDYFGQSITKQREEIAAYKEKFDAEVMSFAEKSDAERNKWCYYDMLRRGAIDALI